MSNDLPPRPPDDITGCIVDACVHLDTTARLIEAGHTEDPFHPNLALAAQVSLLAAAIHPGVQASQEADDPWAATAHLDHALALLGSLPQAHVTDDMRRCCTHLAHLRDAIDEANARSHENGTPR